mgnify:CR=1 FL=1
MTREEAIAIARSDPKIIVEVLLSLSARIVDLERKIALLFKDSSNSSKPPSSDGGGKPRPRPAKKSKNRNPGGQPGHKDTNRSLVPMEEKESAMPAGVRMPYDSPDGCSARSAGRLDCSTHGETTI